MYRTFAMATLAVCGFVMTPAVFTPPLIAHQQTSTSDVEVMIHLDPDDSPYAGKPTLTWFMLMRRNGDMISPSSCNCRVVAYDSRNRAIAHHLPLSPMPIEGHQKGHEAISTMITFPRPGFYTVVLSGSSKKGDFNQFELKFPVKVRPQSS